MGVDGPTDVLSFPIDSDMAEPGRWPDGGTDALLRPDAIPESEWIAVTDGALLRGVRYTRGGATTDSIVMRSRSGTVRRVEAQHALDKLERFSGREYR